MLNCYVEVFDEKTAEGIEVSLSHGRIVHTPVIHPENREIVFNTGKKIGFKEIRKAYELGVDYFIVFK